MTSPSRTIRRILYAPVIIGMTLMTMPLCAVAAQDRHSGASTAEQASVERSERRIDDLHRRLHITAAQETKWTPVAQVMRDNFTTFAARISAKSDAKTAVEDLKIFAVMAEEHQTGLTKLIPVFEVLYNDLTPAQRNTADHLFGKRVRNAGRD